jgi:hypothetical protein
VVVRSEFSVSTVVSMVPDDRLNPVIIPTNTMISKDSRSLAAALSSNIPWRQDMSILVDLQALIELYTTRMESSAVRIHHL